MGSTSEKLPLPLDTLVLRTAQKLTMGAKNIGMLMLPIFVNLVRTARLELAHLSALPPQDSVSTNFTTSAMLHCLNGLRNYKSLLLSRQTLSLL